MTFEMVSGVLFASIAVGTAILLATLGEMLSERSGVINLGVEGLMLIGAASGFLFMAGTRSHWFGLGAAALFSGIIAFCYSLLTVFLHANQIVSGLALVIFCSGLSNYLGKPFVGKPPVSKFGSCYLPLLSDLPFIGNIFFRHNVLVYITIGLSVFLWYFFFKTRPGLELRAVGEDPGTADSTGINVFGKRCFYVTLGGALMGMGGAYISLAHAPSWIPNITAGRGWIAIALVIFSRWNPLRAIAGAFIFGGIDSLVFRLQLTNVNVSLFLLKMLPYVITIAVLVLTVGRGIKSDAPASLGIAYRREEKR